MLICNKESGGNRHHIGLSKWKFILVQSCLSFRPCRCWGIQTIFLNTDGLVKPYVNYLQLQVYRSLFLACYRHLLSYQLTIKVCYFSGRYFSGLNWDKKREEGGTTCEQMCKHFRIQSKEPYKTHMIQITRHTVKKKRRKPFHRKGNVNV